MQKLSEFGCILLMGTAFVLSSCLVPVPVPGTIEVSPGICGRIIDGKTKSPIPNADVSVFGTSLSENRSRPSTVTDSDGRFSLPADKRLFLMRVVTPCPVYHFPPTGEATYSILISHPEYESLKVNIYDYCNDIDEDKLNELGDIEIVTRQ